MKIRIKKRYTVPVFLTLLLILPSMIGYIYEIIARIGIVVPINIINFILWGSAILLFGKFLWKKIQLGDIAFYMICILIAALSYAFSDNIWFTSDKLFSLIFTIIPCYFLGLCYEEYEMEEKSIYNIAEITLVVNTFYLVRFLTNGKMLLSDNMDWAYKILPAICIVTNRMIDKKEKGSIVFFSLSVLMLLALGTRGPILCLGIFIILKCIKKYGYRKNILAVCILLVFTKFITATRWFEIQLIKLAVMLKTAGFSPRIVEMILKENLTDANGRDVIQDILISKIKEKPYLGYGIFSDRILTMGHGDYDSTYAHNIILEFMCDYGVILGVILFVVLCIFIFRAFRKIENKNAGDFLTVVVCGFVHLFLSGSYLQSTMFFCLLGMCVAILRKRVISDENIMDL